MLPMDVSLQSRQKQKGLRYLASSSCGVPLLTSPVSVLNAEAEEDFFRMRMIPHLVFPSPSAVAKESPVKSEIVDYFANLLVVYAVRAASLLPRP